MKVIELTAEKEMRLDIFLRENLSGEIGSEISNSKLRRLIVAGAVSVNGVQCRRPAFILRKKSRVEVRVELEKLYFEKDNGDIDFTLTEKDVLFEDEDIIIINKPPFLPSEGTIVESRKSAHSCVIEYLWKKNPSLRNPPYAGIMHRLDRETSGVLLFTKTRKVNAAVHEMFGGHTARKTYRAICSRKNGAESRKNFTVENFIGRISPKSAKCMMGPLDEKKGGQFAKTGFSVASEKDGLVFMDCFLFTGRTHQIRVHLSSRNLPIVGDGLYGGTEGFSENGGRIMLHAWKLEFPHPVTKETMTVTAPLPELFGPG